LLGGAVRLQEDTGVAIVGLVPFGRERDTAIRTVRNQLGEDAYRAAYQRGTELATEDVYQLALRPQAGSSTLTLDRLSGRRRQVAVLIAQGLENRQIADRLHHALSTVENHVSDTLRILGFTNRTQVASWVSLQMKDSGKS
jgi:non-specific serine/threonine protein kinase